jgi:hypothetical protein
MSLPLQPSLELRRRLRPPVRPPACSWPTAEGHKVLECSSSVSRDVRAPRPCLLDAERIRDSPGGRQAPACPLWARGISYRPALGGVRYVRTVTDFR